MGADSRGFVQLGFLLLFLCGREENVVQNQPVSGGIFVQVQIGRRITDGVLIVLGVMSSVPCEGPPPKVAMNIFDLLGSFALRQHYDCSFEQTFFECGRLPHEPFDDGDMVLR